MENQQTEIRIYVACLAAYNNGILHGAWIDANQDVETINNAILDMLKASPIEYAEEFAIHDYEGFEGVEISEYQGIDSVAELAAFITEHGTLGAELLNYYSGNLDEAQSAMEDHYYGCYSSLSDFAEELTSETTEIPESLRFYIDYEAMARDLEINDVLAIKTGFDEVHVFWSH